MASITITADTEFDPYSAFWANVPADHLTRAEQHFIDSPAWSRSSQPTDVRTAKLCAYIEPANQPARLYVTTDPYSVDAAADTIETLLRRGPDSLT